MGMFLRGVLVLSVACGALLLILYCVSPFVLKPNTVRKLIPQSTSDKITSPKKVKFIPRINTESLNKRCKNLDGFDHKILSEIEKKPPQDLFLYSGYHDMRKQKQKGIRILGLTVKRPPRYYCQLYYTDGAVKSGIALIQEIEVDKKNRPLELNHFPYIILCDEFRGETPLYVSLTLRPCIKTPSNAMQIKSVLPKTEAEVPDKILVFVETLYNFHFPYHLIEFMEYQKLLGADHVILYDYWNATKEVEKVIGKYVKDGFMTIQRWKLKKEHHFKHEMMKYDVRVRLHPHHWKHKRWSPNTYELILHLNDCLYRFMNSYKYIIKLHPHEYLIPQNKSDFTYRHIIDRVYKLKLREIEKATSMAFPGALFCRGNQMEPEHLQIGEYLNRDKVNPGNKVTVFNPRRILSMKENNVLEHKREFGETVAVFPEVALLHHYKKHQQMACSIMDQSALRFTSKLLKNVNKVCTALKFKTLQ